MKLARLRCARRKHNAIKGRRAQNHLDPQAPVVGVALSGGGIRSATFCLGLFQALARQKLVRRIDYLSTVSGGGYFGSFSAPARSDTRRTPTDKGIEDELADNHSWSVNWLRENGPLPLAEWLGGQLAHRRRRAAQLDRVAQPCLLTSFFWC